MGVVMGSKNLEAIAVRGTQGVAVSDAKRFMKVVKHTAPALSSVPVTVTFGGALIRFLPAGGKGNRQSVDVENGITLSALFEQFGMSGDERLLVILNGDVVKKSQYSGTTLAQGDALSLMPPIQAG